MLGSALENRFHAELGYSATGIKRGDANEFVKYLVKGYKASVTKEGGPIGYTFDEIYDLKTLTPRPQFLQVYEKVKKEIEDLGINFRY